MYQAIVYIHVISAITWLGGMLFLAMVMVPLARRDANVGFAVLRDAAKKFLPVAWASMVVLAGSGAYLAWTQWGVRADTFIGGEGHRVQFLQMKTGLFVIVIVLSLAHDFWLGPRMMDRLEEARSSDSPLPTGPARLFVQWAARVNLLLVLAVVALAVVLTRPY
jgi:uncharacterized membrane protein